MNKLSKKFGMQKPGGGVVETLLEIGTPLPAAIRHVVETIDDGQHAIELRVYTAPAEVQSTNTKDWQLTTCLLVRGIEPRPKGQTRIGIMLGINEHESVVVTAFDLDTGIEHTVSSKDI